MRLTGGGQRAVAVLVALVVVSSTFVAFVGTAGAQSSAKADVVFVFDTSGSMGPYAQDLEDNLDSFATQLESQGVDAQFALVGYESASSTTLEQDLTDDRNTIKNAIDSLSFFGGTEDASDAIIQSFDDVSFRDDAKKVIVVVTDEPDDSPASVRGDALNRVQSENGLLVSLSPDDESDDGLKSMADRVDGEWANLLSTDFSDIISRIAGTISEAAGGGSSDSGRSEEFEIGTTLINRTEPEIGEPVGINVTVENVGDQAGDYSALLQADTELIGRQTAEIEPGGYHVFNYTYTFHEPDTHRMFMRTSTIGEIEVTPLRPTRQSIEVPDANGNRMFIRVTDARIDRGVQIELPDAPASSSAGVTMESVSVVPTENSSFQLNLSHSSQAPSRRLTSPSGSDGLYYLGANMSLPPSQIDTAAVRFSVLRDFHGQPAPENIVLYRVDGDGATELETRLVGSSARAYTFRAEFDRFSTFAVGINRPDFAVADADVSTDSVDAGDSVDVTATVQNDGTAAGSFTATLRRNGQAILTRNVTVQPGQSQPLSFSQTFETPGEYTVTINNATVGTVNVAAPPTTVQATAMPMDTPDQPVAEQTTAEPAAEITETTTESASTTTDVSGPGFGIVLALVALLAAAGVLARRDR